MSDHPSHWRRMLATGLGLPSLIALAVLAFAWPAARIQPRELPVGVVAQASGSQQLIARLAAAEPGAFELRWFADPAAARTAITDRTVYGAVVVTSRRVQLLTASAASPAVAQALAAVTTKVMDDRAAADIAATTRIVTSDVVPLSRDDPKGLVFASILLPLTICSILIAAVLAHLGRIRSAQRHILALVALAAIAAAAAFLIGQPFLGALPHHGAADWAALALTVLALSAATTGLITLVGTAGLGLAAAVFVFVGNPFSGSTSAPDLLPTGVDHVGQWLPPGAGAELLRSTAYFHGNGATAHLGVLTVWALLGFAAIAVAHHPPIRFAAHRARAE